MPPIDVWDATSFDLDLRSALNESSALIRRYVTREKANFLEYDHAPRPIGALRPGNADAVAYIAFRDNLALQMASRTIRAWHYTRMTDDEVAALTSLGLQLSTVHTLRLRLDALVQKGTISKSLAEALFERSPLHSEQGPSRTGRFWLTSHPQRIDDSGVTRLLKYWGGEVASFWTDSEQLLQPISRIGKPRVLEVAVPLEFTKQAFGAAQAVIATHARTIGCVESGHGFDISVVKALPPSALIDVHSEAEAAFSQIGNVYPSSFVDIDRGYWNELTGESDA